VTRYRHDEQTVRQLKALGQAFREARLRTGLTQEVLAERSGVSASTVGQVERGTVNPGYDVMLAMAKAMSLPLSSILHRAAEPPEVDG
jgi:transcriptional regulator with XRE-family HTH domain